MIIIYFMIPQYSTHKHIYMCVCVCVCIMHASFASLPFSNRFPRYAFAARGWKIEPWDDAAQTLNPK